MGNSIGFGQLAFVIIIMVTSLYVVSSLYDTTPDTSFIADNESVTVVLDQWIELSNSGIAQSSTDDETAYNTSGSILTEGTDYEYSPANTSILFYSSSVNVAADESATITYSYEAKPEMVNNVVPMIGTAFSVGSMVALVLMAALILGLVGGFGKRKF